MSHNLILIRNKVEQAWSIETTFTPEVWSENNKAQGQCHVTSMLVKFWCGGVLMMGNVNGQPHSWNRINGIDVDLTWRQFQAGTIVTDIHFASYEDLMQNQWMEERLKNFIAAFNKSN